MKDKLITDLSVQDMKNTNGGIIPLAVIAAWGTFAQLSCCAVTVAAYLGYKANRV